MQRLRRTLNKTADYTIKASDSGAVIVADAVDLTFTLPAGAAGLYYFIIVRTLSATTGLIVDGNGSETINGATTLTNTAGTDARGDGMFIAWDGAEWVAIEEGTWA